MGRFAILAGDLRFFDDILQRTLNSDFLHQEKVDTLGLLGETCLSQKRRMSQQAVNAYRLANELAPTENQLAYARCLALIDVVREQLIAGSTDAALDAINEYRAICAKDISQIDESEPETKQSIAWRCLLAAPLTCFPEDPRDRSRLEKAQRVALESLHATESQDLAAKSQRANILGVACYRLGKFDEARTYFEQSEAQLQGDDKEGYLHGVNLLFLTLTHHQLKTAAKDNAQRVELLKDWLRRYLSDANAYQFQEHLELTLFQQELIDAGVITQFITPVMDPL